MKPSILPLPILVAATFGCNPDAFAATISGNATLTSDYVWRGSSQTQGDAAVQAGFRVAAAEGLYAAVSGSNVEFAPQVHASSELDVSVGWAGALSPEWSIDANLLHYRYPATTVDLNWTELNTTVTWRRDYWLSLGWSPQALGTRQDGLYSQLGARWPVNERLRLEAMAGYYTLQDARGGGYAHGQLNAVWRVTGPLELRLSAHGTDRRAKTLFGDDLAGTRWEVAVQGAF
ncbi:MAG: TorF family putative porin [Stenotrophomonas sp.]